MFSFIYLKNLYIIWLCVKVLFAIKYTILLNDKVPCMENHNCNKINKPIYVCIQIEKHNHLTNLYVLYKDDYVYILSVCMQNSVSKLVRFRYLLASSFWKGNDSFKSFNKHRHSFLTSRSQFRDYVLNSIINHPLLSLRFLMTLLTP